MLSPAEMNRSVAVLVLSLVGAFASGCSGDAEPTPRLRVGPEGCAVGAFELSFVEPDGAKRPISTEDFVCTVRIDGASDTASWEVHLPDQSWFVPTGVTLTVARDAPVPTTLTAVALAAPGEIRSREAVLDLVWLRDRLPSGTVSLRTLSSERSDAGLALDAAFDVTFRAPNVDDVRLVGALSLRAR